MAEPSGSNLGKRDNFRRDFATVLAGYLVGHGVLRLSAGFLIGLGDAPRADLLMRWLPVWNALGWFVAAWGLYRLVLWAGELRPVFSLTTQPTQPRLSEHDTVVDERLAAKSGPSPASANSQSAAGPEKISGTPPTAWKERIKGLQKRKDVEALLDLQTSLSQTLPRERAEQLNRRLGRWYTKHFQRVMLTGRAAESLADVERVADYYADSEEFAYFREVLPVVRQCAELKQSIQDEE